MIEMPNHIGGWAYRSLFAMMVCCLMIVGNQPVQAVERDANGIEVDIPPVEGPSVDSLGELKWESGQRFTENRGQIGNSDVLYYTTQGHMMAGFMTGGVLLVLDKVKGTFKGSTSLPTVVDDEPHQLYAVKLRFEGGSNIAPVGQGPLPGRSSFILGNDPSKWTTSVLGYQEVIYKGIYNGIDVRFYFKEEELKYDLIVHPGADLDQVIFSYDGEVSLEIDPGTGDALIQTPLGCLRDHHPIATQDQGGLVTSIPCSFTRFGHRSLGFSIDGAYREGLPLLIDPGLKYATFLGGYDDDNFEDFANDKDGNVYVVGSTDSPDFPNTPGCYDDLLYSGNSDGFVAKFNPTLTRLIFCTYIGGKEYEQVRKIIIRPDGASYMIGSTSSSDFPVTANAYCTTYGGDEDAFLLILNNAGTDLLYSTFIGGSDGDYISGLAIDASDDIYISGSTRSQEFPVTDGAFMTSLNGTSDGYVLKFDSTLTSLIYGTFIGTSESDGIGRIFVYPDGSVIAQGSTRGIFPTTSGAYSATYVNDGSFVLRLNPAGDGLIFSTMCPDGTGDEYQNAFATDNQYNVYIGGMSNSYDYPITSDALNKSTDGCMTAYLSIISDNGTSLSYSTFLHCEDSYTSFNGIDLNPDGDRLAIIGATHSRKLPVTDGAFDKEYRDIADYSDSFLCVLNLTSKQLSYVTYLGGRVGDYLHKVEFLQNDRLCIGGDTDSSDFYNTTGAFSSAYNGGGDVVVLFFDPAPGKPPSAPADFQTIPSDWEIFLNWSRPTDEGGCRILKYELNRLNVSTGQWDLLLNVYDFLYHDWNVSNGKSYRYRVRAISNAGAGEFFESVATVLAVIPTTPLNLTARTGDGTVTLNWSSPAFDGGGRITSYVIMRGLSRDEMGEVAQLGNETSWVDTTVELGTFYYYKVAAKNSAGIGPFTPEVRIKPVGLPSSPRSFSVTPGDGRVDLSWALPSSTGGMMLLGFKVYRGTNPGNVAFLATKIITELSHTDTGVTNGISYLYYVTAYTELGESSPSTTLDATPFGIPGKPMNLMAIAGDGEVVLSWVAPISDGGRAINRYKIYYGEDGGDLGLLVKIGNTTSFTHTGLVNGHLYEYDVRAVNEAGDGPVSERTSARPIGPPGIAGNFHADIAPEGVRLDWNAPAMTGGATLLHYRILRGLQATGLESIKEVVGSTEYLDAGLSKGTTYYYQLQAFNDVGSGPLTDVVSVTYVTVPDAVTDLASRAGNGKVTLTWSVPLSDGGTSLTGYSIRRGLFESGLNEIKRISSSSLNYTDEGIENGKTYFYSVLALNAIGASSTAPIVNVTPRAPPGPPMGFISKVEGNAVVLTWFKPTVAGRAIVTGYRLLRGTSSDDLVLLADLGDVQTYTDTTVEKGKIYYYVVMANSDVGPGDRSSVVKADLKVKKQGSGFDVGIAVGAMVIIGLLACMSNRRRP